VTDGQLQRRQTGANSRETFVAISSKNKELFWFI